MDGGQNEGDLPGFVDREGAESVREITRECAKTHETAYALCIFLEN